MEIPAKLYSVQAKDLIVGNIFYADDYENNGGITPFKLLEKPIIKNNIIILKVINLKLKIDQDFLINPNMPREIFLDKLETNWRKV